MAWEDNTRNLHLANTYLVKVMPNSLSNASAIFSYIVEMAKDCSLLMSEV